MQRILTVIQQIPHGHVATYGQIAKLAGLPRNARQVGSILKSLPPGSGVPWFRVVNSKGEISDRRNPNSELTQRQALEEEQITFNNSGRISLQEYRWEP
jgi:methylated-DNA-protein-cysteine methyltransferase-like protein